MKVTKIILLTIIFSLFTLHASALSFVNFSVGGTGFINNGNGYFDDPAATFNYSGDSRNVYVVAENTQVWIFEPISRSAGTGAAYGLINSSVGFITSAVVHDGYLYFVDNSVLKKKKTRNLGNTCESTDTSAGGCISIIVSSNVGNITINGNTLYYTQGATLKHLDSNDNAVSDFALPTIPGTLSQYSALGVVTNSTSGTTDAWVTGYSGVQVYLYRCRSVGGCSTIGSSISNNAVEFSSFFTTSTYIYALQFTTAGGSPSREQLYYISNSTAVAIDYVTDNTLQQGGRVYVGGQSTIGLVAQTTTSYETFNSIEAGQDSLPTFPSELTYTTKDVASLQTTYYNNSNVQISYNIVVPTNAIRELDSVISQAIYGRSVHGNFRWIVGITDPNSVEVLTETTDTCNLNFLQDECSISGTFTFIPSAEGWINGTWTPKLYEQDINNLSKVLITTGSTYTVLNQTSTGGTTNPGCGSNCGNTPPTINTAIKILNVLSVIAFWGFALWLGIIGSVIYTMSKNPSGVNGTAVIIVAWLSAIMIALIGLFDPYKIYIIVISTIIAAVMFKYGRQSTVED